MIPKFTSEQTVATSNAVDFMEEHSIDGRELLNRHFAGDWGNQSTGDIKLNDAALENGSRVMSSFDTSGGTLWIITEWDRSVTTILMPSDY